MSEWWKGKRHDDPPGQSLAYRLGLAVQKYPVLLGATIAVLVATVALVIVLKQQGDLRQQQSDLRREKASNVRLNSAALGSCRRLQIVRDQENHTGALLYLVFHSSADRERVLAKGPAGAIHALQEHIYATSARAAHYAPPTDCRAAVSSPATYQPPQPLPFTMARARHLEPGIANDLEKSSQALINYERRLLKSLEGPK